MATTLTSTGITFPDATTQTTAAGSTTPSAYAIGSYVLAAKTTGGTTNTTQDETIAGANLRYPCEGGSVPSADRINVSGSFVFYVNAYNPSLSGTWRAMAPAGNGTAIFESSGYYIVTEWLRIS